MPALAIVLAAIILAPCAVSRGPNAPQRASELAAGEPPRRGGDVYCGPRCVQYVLDYYGKHCDLVDLVDEIQQPNWWDGSRLRDIDRALRRRGLFTAPLIIDPSTEICWDRLAVVHVKPTDSEVGHFVVQLQSDSLDRLQADGSIPVWSGLHGVIQRPPRTFRRSRSGAVLLVAAHPFNPASAVAKNWAIAIEPVLGSLGLCIVLAAVLLLRRRRFFRVSSDIKE